MKQSQHQQYKRQEQSRTMQQTDIHVHHELKCGHCGASYDENDLYCPECGKRLGGRHCNHCGAELTATCEICPHCGHPTDSQHCSFCGAAFEGDEPFCSECGSPRSGIVCPDCGTRSFRSFCPKCNRPLNDNAAEAIAQAQRDPKYQRVLSLNQEMAEMERYLLDFKQEIESAIAEAEAEAEAPDAPGLSNEGEQLQNQYAELMKLLGELPDKQPSTPVYPQPETVEKRKRELKLKFANANDIMAAYKAKAQEMQAALKEMLPDADMPPEQQRDYACARKVPIIIKEKTVKNTWWVCNFCGCYHHQPSECSEPWHGGNWINEEVEIETKIWKYID